MTPFAAVSEPLWIYTLMRFIGFSKSSFTMSDGIRLPVPGGRFMKISSNSSQRFCLKYSVDRYKIILSYGFALKQRIWSGRKQKKRQFRQLWIARINAAARMNGLSYSKLMHGLKVANIDINRKMLAELAVNDAEGFTALAEIAKKAIA